MSTTNTVIITGGTLGIGLGLARRYHRRGDRVLVTGRSEARLAHISDQLPGLLTFAGDLSREADRERLASYVMAELPKLNVLINNAGIQRRVEIALDTSGWSERQTEIDLLLSAPLHLSAMLTPLMFTHGLPSQIVNVTSGGAFIPQPFAPTYSAAKAALHSYTMNLRWALTDTNIRVTELIPPAVATGLAGPGSSRGADVDEFCDAVFPGLVEALSEVGFGPTDAEDFTRGLSREHAVFESMATRFPIARYEDQRSRPSGD
jgi:uncharacterized oxidoreductase